MFRYLTLFVRLGSCMYHFISTHHFLLLRIMKSELRYNFSEKRKAADILRARRNEKEKKIKRKCFMHGSKVRYFLNSSFCETWMFTVSKGLSKQVSSRPSVFHKHSRRRTVNLKKLSSLLIFFLSHKFFKQNCHFIQFYFSFFFFFLFSFFISILRQY